MQDARGHAAPDSKCIYMRQSMSTCVIINMLHFWCSKNLPNLKLTDQLAYIVTGTDSDCGRYYNIFKTFHNVSMMYSIALIAVILIIALYSF